MTADGVILGWEGLQTEFYQGRVTADGVFSRMSVCCGRTAAGEQREELRGRTSTGKNCGEKNGEERPVRRGGGGESGVGRLG